MARIKKDKRDTSRSSKSPKSSAKKGASTPKNKTQKAPKRVGGAFTYYGVLIAVTILVGISILMVISASSGEYVIDQVGKQAAELSKQGKVAGLSQIDAPLLDIAIKHIIPIIIGVVLCVVISRINYHTFLKYSVYIALGSLLLLILVALFGDVTLGARRWIYIGGMSLQPSEFTKAAILILVVSAFYSLRIKKNFDLSGYADWGIPFLVFAVSCLFLYLQPDLGTLFIILTGVVGAYLAMELPVRRLVVGLGIVGVLGIGAIISIPNRVERILRQFGGNEEGVAQIINARIAIGSGGLFGMGPGLSRQKYTHLPEAQNDFILAIIGEELGLLGITVVFAAFFALIWCGFRVAIMAKDITGRALAGGAITMLAVQTLLNIFSVTGLGPVTGKPLPFVAQGGSAMMGAFVLVGIILSVSRFGHQGEPAKRNSQRLARVDVQASPAKRPARQPVKQPAKPRKKIDRRQEQDEDNEVSLDWRRDSGPRIPSSRSRTET